jgi:hypothetical protein
MLGRSGVRGWDCEERKETTMETDEVLASRIELIEDEICLRSRRLDERIHEVERSVARLAEGAHEAVCSGGLPGIDVRTVRVLDLFEEKIRSVDVASIRRDANELASMKAVADAMHVDLTGPTTATPWKPPVLRVAA